MKTTRTDGAVAATVSGQRIPKMCKVRQEFDNFKIPDIEAEVRQKLKRPGTLDRIKPGYKIAITAGSRGVANISRITRVVVDEVKRAGGAPFIIPSMGSHGGATAEGQLAVLANYDITETTIGCPVISSMATVQIGISSQNKPVHIDKTASEADGIIVINRIKPHTAFRGTYESGLLKMITIGLGKQYGAEICHSDGFEHMEENVTSLARVTLETHKILLGLAIIENAYHNTRRIEAIPAENIFREEPALLVEAKANMPGILFKKIDVLIVDQIGKNISGDGMDPNITGTFCSPCAAGGSTQQRTVVLDITDESDGNGIGLGMADFSVPRALDKVNLEMTYPNAITSTALETAKIPLIMANDRLAIQAAIKTCNNIDYKNPQIVRITDTLKLDEILISESLLDAAKDNPKIQILGEPQELVFNERGNLF